MFEYLLPDGTALPENEVIKLAVQKGLTTEDYVKRNKLSLRPKQKKAPVKKEVVKPAVKEETVKKDIVVNKPIYLRKAEEAVELSIAENIAKEKAKGRSIYYTPEAKKAKVDIELAKRGYFTENDLNSSEELVEKLKKTSISTKGLRIEQTGFGTDNITIRGAGDEKLDSSADQQFAIDLPAVKVGPNLSKEERKQNAEILNKYISDYGDDDYTVKSKDKYGTLYKSIWDKTKSEAPTQDQRLKKYLQKQEEDYKQASLFGTGPKFSDPTEKRMAGLASKNVTPKLTPEQKYRAETGKWAMPSQATVNKWWDNKEKEAREAKLNGAIGDLPVAERTALSAINQDRILSENKSDKDLYLEGNELKKGISDYTKKAKIFNENPTSIKEFNQLKREEQKLFALRDEFNKKVQTQKSNYARISAITDTALDDYDRLSQTGTLLKNTGLSILAGAGDLIATTQSASLAAMESSFTDKTFSKSYKEKKDFLKETFIDPIYSQKKDAKDELDLYQKDLNIGQVKSVKDFGRWAMGVATQMPSSLAMAMTGEAAMPLFFLSSYGEKSYELVQNKTDAALGLLEIQEMIKNGEVNSNDPEIEKEILAYKKTLGLSEGQEFTSKMIAGLAEAGFEKLGSIGIVKRTAEALKAIPKSSIKEASKALGGQIALSIPVESATETLTQLANNLGDIHILGENKSMFEGVADAAAAGAFMGPGFALGGSYKGMRTAIASEVITRAEIKQRASKVKELEKMLGLNNLAISDITKEQVNGLNVDPRLKDAANEIINQLENEDLKVLQRLESMNSTDIQTIGDINQQLRKVQRDWQEASMDGELNFVQLEGLKEYYKGKWKSLQDQREAILNKGVAAEGTKIPIEGQINFENLIGSEILSARQTKNTYLNAKNNFKNLSKSEKEEYLEEAKARKDYREESKDSFAAEVYADKQVERLLDANIEASNAMLGEGNELIVVKNVEELKDKEPALWQMLEEDRVAKEEKGEKVDYAGTNGFKTPEGRTVILKDNAIKNKHTSTGSHEALHIFTDEAIASPSGKKAMKDLQEYLEEKQPNFWLTVKERLKAYEEGDIADGQELMQAISDSYLDGTKVDRSTFNNIAIAINKASKGKLFPSANNANFSLIKPDTGGITPSGKALFDTVINYSRRTKGDAVNVKGISKLRVISPEDEDQTEVLLQKNFGSDKSSKISFSKSKVDELKEELAALEEEYDEGYGDMEEGDYKNAKSNLETKIRAEIKLAAKAEPATVVEKPKKEVSEESSVKEIIKENKGKISSDKVQEIYDKKGVEGALEIMKLFKPITARIVDKRRDAPGFSEPDLTYEIENGKGGILDLIMKYNPEEGVPLAAYINKYLPVRAITASRRVLDKEFTSDVSEEVNVAATETADQNMTERVAEKPTYKNALESKIFTPDILETVNNKILPIVRTLKSRIDTPVTLNRTVTPLIAEIRDEIGKQLDIDIKTMLGGKKDGVLRKELLRTKRYILENMTTTWLMGKDGQGGIPQAIQKKIDGKWVSFPNWVGQKIDREAMSTDLAGRTSGAELVRRLPNVFNNVSDEDFLAQIIGPDGNPIRGRKESVSKAMAEESAMDIINADLINEGPIYEALKVNQERLGVEVKEAFVQEYLKQSERGNIKRSLSGRPLKDALKALEKANWDPKSESFIKYTAPLPPKVKEGINEMLSLQKNIGALRKRLKAITLENAGVIFEKQMLASAIIAVKDFKSEIGNFKVLTKKAAGSNSTVVDLQIEFKYNNKSKKPIIFNIELKADKNAQISSFTINNITSKENIKIGNRSTPLTDEAVIKEAIANSQGVKDYVEYFLNNGGSFTSRGNIRVPVKTFYEAQGSDKTGDVNLQAKANTLIKDLTVDTIVELNKRKANPNNIIILGDSGAFTYEEGDIAGLPNISEVKNENREKSFQIIIRPVRGKETNGMTTVAFRAFPSISSKWNKQSTVNTQNGAEGLLKVLEAHAKINFSKSIAISQEAVAKSLTFSKSPKGISVFDFDDTVGLTKGSVLYTMPDGTEGKLNAEEFAKEGSAFLEQGAVFDFSEFSKVVDGKPGPMVQKMKKMIDKFGPDNFFILTARPADAAGPIHEFLKSIDINIPLENITGLGNSTAQAKADWITNKVAEGYNDFYFADDAVQNVEAVKKALNIPGVDSKVQQAMLKFSLTSKQDLKWDIGESSSTAYFNTNNKEYYISLTNTGYFGYSDKDQISLNNLIKKYNLEDEEANLLGSYEGGVLNLAFGDEYGSVDITGAGNAFEVFGTVINGVLDYVKNNETEGIIFTAAEPSRKKLYNSMAAIYAEKLKWNAFYEDGVYIISKYPVRNANNSYKLQSKQADIKFSLTTKQALKWELDEDGHNALFTVGGRRYYMSLIDTGAISYDDKTLSTLYEIIEQNDLDMDAVLSAKDGSSLNLEFLDRNKGQGITDKGNAFKVISIVANGMMDRVKDKGIETLVFTAKEPSRIKLYNALSTVFSAKLGWDAYFKDGVYVLTKNEDNIGVTTGIGSLKPVKDVLNVVDIKSPRQQEKLKFSKTISSNFNKILEENVGVKAEETFSAIVAKRKGKAIGKYRFFVPPSAADLELLIYDFLGYGETGERQQQFFNKALFEPYANGIALIDAAKQSIKNDYKALLKAFPEVSKELGKLTPDGNFTYDQAIRVSMWAGMGEEVPGISEDEVKELNMFVNQNPDLAAFKAGLIATGRQDAGWVAPTEYWDSESIVSDLHNITDKVGRKKYLAEFIDNSKEMFSKENLNKIEAIYGSNFRDALEDIIYRMTNGTNRESGPGRINAAWLNWINNSTGAIMFWNTRSAVLQTIGSINYLNWRDNNPLNAAKAFANQPQYWKDFAYIWNSDKMKERRSGLKEDVSSSEIANAAAGTTSKANAVISYLLKKGFLPTQIGDSFAIASGGAAFYRNRINYNLKQGMTEAEAEAEAWKEFLKVTDQTQQSGDPRDISQQQAGIAGRLVLAFQNTAMQQARLVKKAGLDLVNRRGDAKTNISKIVYYTAVQNIIFGSLQSALFATIFSDDDDEEKEKKKQTTKDKWLDIGNNIVDTILRGSGMTGAIVATLKNVYLKYNEESEKGFKAEYAKVLIEAANVAPAVGSKLSKGFGAMRTMEFEKDVIAKRGWSVTADGKLNLSPSYSVLGQAIEATTNLPANRFVNKVNNLSEALDSRNKSWQRIALAVGYTPYTVGVKNEENETIKAEAKVFRKQEGLRKAEETRTMTRDSLNKLSPEDFKAYVLKKKTERLAEKDSINNLPKAQLDKYLKQKEASGLFSKKQKEVLEEIKRDSINSLSIEEYFKYLDAVENKKEIAKINRMLNKLKEERKRNIYK